MDMKNSDEITHWLVELLCQRDEVIIPSFGIFRLQYEPTAIHPVQHLFQPPSRALLFEKNRTKEDDLFAQWLSKQTGITHDAASQKIIGWVLRIEMLLETTGHADMAGLGRFFFDIEHQLQFAPDRSVNFLRNSYGLEDFISPAILRKENMPQHPMVEVKKKKRLFWFRF